MSPFHLFACVLSCLAALRCQEVVCDDGEVLAGSVTAVKDNRVQIRGVDGAVRQLPVRRVLGERQADGTMRRFHAELRDAAIDAAGSALLARVQKGQQTPFGELMQVTERCSRALCDALRQELQQGSAAARLQAAQALAVTAVPEAVRAALEAGVAESSGRMLAAIAAVLNDASLGAIEAAEAQSLLDQALATKNAGARFAMASLGAQLGSDAALPVLERFLGDGDHHVREAAAVALAERGNATGAAIVLTMAKRDRAPVQTANCNADAETKALVDRLALRERCHACELLGKLRHEPALPVLKRLAANKDPTLAAAAQRALDAFAADH